MGRADPATLAAPCDLVRIRDLAGRPRGTGFAADRHGTLLTSHESVDGLTRLVLHAPGERVCLAEADAITPLPEAGLALVRTEGLGLRPLPLTTRRRVVPGTGLRLPAGGWHHARALGAVQVVYTATDRHHLIDEAVELAVPAAAADALRLGGEATGGPVLDAANGAVLAVLGTALQSDRRASALALPLRTPVPADGPLAELLRRNAATVPAHGDDLNLAAVLELTAAAPGPHGRTPPYDRPGILTALTALDPPLLALVGDPGTGRTTALAALAAHRAHRPEPAPTLWLRGCDLHSDDASVADAVARALRRAGRLLTASGAPADLAEVTPERAAHLAHRSGRPLLVILDGPEEMPPALAHRLPSWTAATAHWLSSRAARMVLACRPEHWERAEALHPAAHPRPVAMPLADLSAPEAAAARQGYGLPADAIAPADAAHPLALRLLAEVRGALPARVGGRPGRDEIFGAHLDLLCLRIAGRIAAASRPPPRGSAVRRLAARVAGRVHEAARRCLGPGHGELDRESFEELFPWRPGWAAAVLTERLLVPAGAGYRFAHEEVAEWIQGAHLDPDAALHALIRPRAAAPAPARLPSRPGRTLTPGHVPPPPGSARHRPPPPLPVPRHRIGPVVHSLLLLDRVHGPAALTRRLKDLIDAVARPDAGPDAHWWATRLLAGTLLALPAPEAYLPMLRLLADRLGRRPARAGAPAGFGPAFWLRLRIPEADRLDLLRRLIPADGPPGTPGPRVLDAVAALLEAGPVAVQPLLCRWFTDETALAAAPGDPARPTVAAAAQALLYARRTLAVDDLAEALAASGHARSRELLGALARDEPSALCRAVDRWVRDPRPDRRALAAAHAPAAADHCTTAADRALLRHAAYELLGRAADTALHGAALALLVRDPHSRSRCLEQALTAYARAAPGLPASALAAALITHPGPVLAVFRARLRADDRAGEVLRALAEVTVPALARRAAALVAEYLDRHPGGGVHAAAFVDRRLDQGPSARSLLFPLVSAVLQEGPGELRQALAPVLAAAGTARSRPLRAELLGVLLRACPEDEPGTPAALLEAAALGCADRPEDDTRELVRRSGLLIAAAPTGGPARFEEELIRLARTAPGFARLLVAWPVGAAGERPLPIGPDARRTIGALASAIPMRTEGPGHGSLRPA
ncbi:serine protease [Streptomyces sp. NPDC014894]|uniref:serine protease n=1 Tax=Streptomyces sp. NPDC014894 TaxID=3364931 RepID=UPI0036F8D843